MMRRASRSRCSRSPPVGAAAQTPLVDAARRRRSFGAALAPARASAPIRIKPSPTARRRCIGPCITTTRSSCERLLEAGADVAAANDYGATPMSEAAVAANVAVLAALLEAGADVDSPNADGQTALMVVARGGNIGGGASCSSSAAPTSTRASSARARRR